MDSRNSDSDSFMRRLLVAVLWPLGTPFCPLLCGFVKLCTWYITRLQLFARAVTVTTVTIHTVRAASIRFGRIYVYLCACVCVSPRPCAAAKLALRRWDIPCR